MADDVSVVDLARLIAAGTAPVIVDVREPVEFTGPLGHAPGAINIPLQSLPLRLAELEQFRTQRCHIICLSGGRSAMAARWLTEQGFAEACNVTGGMKAWNHAGLPKTLD
jgi:rhodanese-related sulfurtransferase